jgi:mono/diheme cytochrome c family protein
MAKYHHKLKTSLVILCLLLAAFVASAVQAGGWAVITVEELPNHLVAGQPVYLTFSVRQHGFHQLTNLTPSVYAVKGQAKATATITKEGTTYRAKLTVPQPGDWTITIKSSFLNSDITLLPITALKSESESIPTYSQSERGRRLYVAKGCVACHQHDGAGSKALYPFAPNLTDKHYNDAHLARLLADPQKEIKYQSSTAKMPNLNLKQQEITALVAFLNAGKKV